MAGYKGHIAGGIVFGAAYLAALVYVFLVDAAYRQFTGLELVVFPAVLLGLCVMFALWPDVDTDSKGQNFFYTVFFAIDVVLIASAKFEQAAYLGLLAILPALGHHRGWTHTWWALLLVPSPLLILPYLFVPARPLAGLPFYGAALVGYLSHLVLDGYVVPLPRRRRRR